MLFTNCKMISKLSPTDTFKAGGENGGGGRGGGDKTRRDIE